MCPAGRSHGGRSPAAIWSDSDSDSDSDALRGESTKFTALVIGGESTKFTALVVGRGSVAAGGGFEDSAADWRRAWLKAAAAGLVLARQRHPEVHWSRRCRGISF
eukprot:4675674-Pyramimonas_sp.AAC.1